ncbi:MAG: ThuA domain-containing protein [Candidatus Poribacteria bacterium]|nr:ThuA domain-containing protein [Candidatus Poribacteria bacterium]
MEALKLLIFVGTEGIYHDHAGNGQFLTSMLNGTDTIEADFSQDYDVLADGLEGYDTVLFYTDVGELTVAQENGLLNYIQTGGGFFGLHTAAASFRESKGYHGMLNGFFNGHSPYMDFTVNVSDPNHPITEGLTDFQATDELYYLKHNPNTSHHLMHAYDETKDETHVMAFHHTYGEGRVFYFALGHDMAVLENPSFQKIIRRGALWAGNRL